MKKRLSDLELLALCQQGDNEAFEEIANRYTDKIYRLAMRITKKDSEAEEVVQEVLILVYRKLHTFKHESAFSSWLYRIAFNTALMQLRKCKKFKAVGLDSVDSSDKLHGNDLSNSEFLSIRHELRQLLTEAINTLDRLDRTIFILRDVDRLSNQNVSEITNLSVSAVKSRLHRSRMQLRKALSPYWLPNENLSSPSVANTLPSECMG